MGNKRIMEPAAAAAEIFLWLAALGWVTLQAFRCACTFDEATSILEVESLTAHDFISAANFHPLNSLWIKLCQSLGAGHLPAYRIPGIIGLVLSFFGVRLFFPSRPWIRLAVSALLTGNLYLLDFFFLARGYGISCGLLILGMALCRRPGSRTAGCVCLWAAVLANYTCINWVISFLTAWLLSAFLKSGFTGLRGMLRREWRFAAGNALILIAVSALLITIQSRGLLFFGGRTGPMHDTAGSLIRTFVYEKDFAGLVRGAGWAVLIAGGVLILRSAASSVLTLVKGCPAPNSGPDLTDTPFLFVLASLITWIQWRIFDAYLPYERTALSYYVIFVIALFQSVEPPPIPAIRPSHPLREPLLRVCAGLVTVLCVVHAAAAARGGQCYSWKFDADNRDIAEWIIQNNIDRIGVNGLMEEGLRHHLRELGFMGTIPRTDDYDLGFKAPDEQLNWEAYGVNAAHSPPEPPVGKLLHMMQAGGGTVIMAGPLAPYVHSIPLNFRIAAVFPRTGAVILMPKGNSPLSFIGDQK